MMGPEGAVEGGKAAGGVQGPSGHLGSGWWSDIKIPVLAFLATRAGLFAMVYFSLAFIPLNATDTGLWRAFPTHRILDGWSRWDAGWYMHIAADGYDNRPNHEDQRDTTFWPLYPLMVRVAAKVLGNVHLAGIVVSNLCLLAACILLFRWVREDAGETVATRTILLLSVFPFSFYFSAAHPEGLFLLAGVAAFFFGNRRRWVLAGLGAAAAGATRHVGCLTLLGLAVLYLEQIGFQWRRIRPNALWILLGLAGPLGYALYLGLRFDDPWVFVWGRNVTGWQLEHTPDHFVAMIPGMFRQHWSMSHIHVLTGVVALVPLWLCWREGPKAHAVWAAASLVVAFYAWSGIGRFLAPVFPLFVAAARNLGDRGFLVILYLSALFLALFSVMYSHWYWIAG